MLWIELKYVRAKSDLHPISEAIAADITKYGDNGRQTLFVIFDPYHHIAAADEAAFTEPVTSRPGMLISFVR